MPLASPTLPPQMSINPNGKQPRIDGPVKVTGSAMYASDHNLPGMLYAVPVCATIANGKITALDLTSAKAMPGVKAIYHHGNIGSLFRSGPPQGFSGVIDEKRPPFEDEVVRYYGQYVAAVVALTYEQAIAAANAVKVTYSSSAPDVSTYLTSTEAPKVDSHRGDPDAAFASAPVKVDQTYVTPTETHNPIELHASVADWDGQAFTLYETSQAVVNHQNVMAQMLGVPQENVRVISRFLGSGFGGKLWPWPHALIAASASRDLKRPVKLVVTRDMMFQNVGHRPQTQQRVRLAATPQGKLLAVMHDSLNHTSILDDYSEGCSEATAYSYSVPNLRATSALARRHVGTPTSMRGPGAVPGLFALESAVDELAVALKMDPIALRLLNEPEKDEGLNMPFSSRHFIECLKTGADKFGWANRTPGVGSMKKDGLTLGWGVAGCSWIAERMGASASFELRNDGTARIATATQDIGTGTYTVLANIVRENTGIPHDRTEVVLGDTNLPAGAISGGSWATASCIPAVVDAIQKAQQTLFGIATAEPNASFPGKKAADLAFTDGKVHLKDQPAASGIPFGDILTKANIRAAAGDGKSEGTFGDPKRKFSTHSFGAQFAEVTWQPEIARLRVSRVVTVIDAGHILNPKPARNQIEGAVVMGIGMALFEETNYDPRFGAPINNNLADYIMATNADVPSIDVTFLDYPDLVLNSLGARGVGEIGLAGIAAAITSAVYHATGVRVRELPVRIEDLLPAATWKRA
ncbi:xanthine dehydrogenase family protein molybdopterin-binding subunit [Granulicella tundricola]|uniref:Aldehyde oxidase and xanthine dehydrogenase molybdopterin binding protein n=1 Tax=Granulicella tundricola (strain ATCC BAA-1859 / DSM 23138 / MP5ACTX9) TaxID=1198114 RepID=E8X5Z3_GRATM|nr:xanthine dehydrogenase family protein molybdopterin-binding subunit [Granulicella tundricola]ADW70877.1 aldehyde oxidase and xanthine dehydrogenase molybdopterin binding protein [Granulicella tundricola MP5ACTX9]